MIKLLEKYSKVSWLFTIAIAVFIFYLSSLTFEPGPYTTSMNTIIYHFAIFFVLTFFFLPALVKGKSKKLFLIGIILAIIYAVSDEFHQLFVMGRHGSLTDIMYDSTGILLASFIYVLSLRFRKSKNS